MTVFDSSFIENFAIDTWWAEASWEEFIALVENPAYADGRFYYHQGLVRIEMSPLGSRHGRHNSIISKTVSFFATVRKIPIIEFANTSFRQFGVGEFQPDLAFYIGSGLRVPPLIDEAIALDLSDPPTLIVEVGAESVGDDLGRKRLLYEQSGVQEYWVDDLNSGEVIAFKIADGQSGRIQQSRVLPGLEIATVESALSRSQTEDDTKINLWLLKMFSQG
ncbi:MAG: Uma2 family endonuclease [Kastovskya adunca ATA6-11-RM4]|jgi:Uma2 family endonuclease|nr:Uma2 family endonuclease [Kastovskya adunca ATA6-11-RM4]